MMFPYFVKRA